MSHIGHGTPPAQWLSDQPSANEVREALSFLTAQGTFKFPTFSTGLFCAAAAENPEFQLTGYQSVWVRDNIHIAHALWAIGETDKGVKAVASLLEFYSKHRSRLIAAITADVHLTDVQQRPHIRFDGETLSELGEKWAHAQNDALGYLLWLSCKMLRGGDLQASPETLDVLSLLVRYLAKIEYWQDEDAGHWEETRKVEASSIGTALAGLKELKSYLEEHPCGGEHDFTQLDNCIAQGTLALHTILPFECIQDDPLVNRKEDAALLFLAYPLNIIDAETTLQVVKNVTQQLMGPIGIRRYNGDSYWCADYRDLLSAEKRTSDFSDDTSGRDSLLKPGQEAQWCLFDPIISIIYGQRFVATGSDEDRTQQIFHLRRSLAQLTDKHSRFPAYRCPESYFMEHGEWIPNDICPLLWTQANLRLALEWALK